MTLEERMHSDLSSAMRKKDEMVVTTLRMALAAMHARSIEKKGKGEDATLSDEEAVEVVAREAKKRKEAAEAFAEGGRPELGEKEMREHAVLAAYLPEQVDDVALEAEVMAAIEAVRPEGPKDMGKVMAAAMARLKGKADGTRVSACVKRKLTENA